MVILLRSIGEIVGASLAFGIWMVILVCVLAYLFFYRKIRSKLQISVSLVGIMISELVCECFWSKYYFPNGEYYNHGLHGGLVPMVIWPLLLLTVCVVVTAIEKIQLPSIWNKKE